MFVRWLTQAGLVFDNGRITVMVDPYLSNSVGERCPEKNRRIPVDESMFDIEPDVIIITHEHLDHLDPETLKRFLDKDRRITVLAPYNAYLKLSLMGGGHNYVMLRPGSVWSQGGIAFYAVRAEHSDLCAAGYILDDGKKTYYVSGDTLYNYDVIDDVIDLCEDGVDFAFLPINGVGNNMNARDAADFAEEIGAKCAIPLHYGLFDSISPDEFDFEDKLVLKPYERIEL
ncbi:MAG: MBL fold metallo-hydrolase [Clostridia bacterium]|nr:MBL fold metallo-hydrolase [Clostridia bacterium]MBQ2737406.1 MBL fold metallo-hydrolase [Clostridia bacterium]MBQ8290580.1 MBL fold metallo-hydrolase [Clostridia bacterium]